MNSLPPSPLSPPHPALKPFLSFNSSLLSHSILHPFWPYPPFITLPPSFPLFPLSSLSTPLSFSSTPSHSPPLHSSSSFMIPAVSKLYLMYRAAVQMLHILGARLGCREGPKELRGVEPLSEPLSRSLVLSKLRAGLTLLGIIGLGKIEGLKWFVRSLIRTQVKQI